MAPTEILARQHHHGLAPLLEALGVRAEFLSGSLASARKREIQGAIAAGEAEVVIGTHAVISEAVEFARLGLAVVDEQHRFGVAQRAALQAKGGELEPHVLALTATPIPRTLALTFYGDLSISTLRHLPPGRQPIRTELRDRRGAAEDRSLHRRRGGGGTPELRGRSAGHGERGADRGQCRGRARSACRRPCRSCESGWCTGSSALTTATRPCSPSPRGALDVLVATTVIEVGIDVPNASVMLVEDAERFGLAQLHQLRGRVGRGPHRSFCILVSDAVDELSRRAAGGAARLVRRLRHRRGATCACAARGTCSARGNPGCRRCGWHRCSSRDTWSWPSGRASWPMGWWPPTRRWPPARSWLACARSSLHWSRKRATGREPPVAGRDAGDRRLGAAVSSLERHAIAASGPSPTA